MKRTIDRLRGLIRDQEYQISIHANEEMSNDELIAVDIESAIFTGKVIKRFTKEARGTRYEVTGQACDGRPVAVICRIPGNGWLRIVTVFVLENN